MRLLVVEDEARIVEILRSALSRAGFAVDAVGLCADARAALEVGPYDAAILDLGLPDGDGLKLLKEMRTRDHAIPVLVLTARDERSRAQPARGRSRPLRRPTGRWHAAAGAAASTAEGL